LVASAFYRQYAPPDAPHLPHHDLDDTLRAALTPALRQAVDAALNDLPAPGMILIRCKNKNNERPAFR
jgi:hypothetical protein